MSTTNHLPIPTTLTGSNGDKYRIVEVLGQGSFGITYRARTKLLVEGSVGKVNTEIDVAVKEFYVKEINSRGNDECSVEGSQSDGFRRYLAHFRREAETLKRLGGRYGVVGVLDMFDANNTSYYVMEYLGGGSLDKRIDVKQGGSPLKEIEALRMAERIGNALNYLHANRMLHLDLKPGNIMLDGDEIPVLIDFGMAKQFDDNGEPLSSSTLGNGTPGYAPTEQASYRPDGNSFPATIDVYAFGATLYKMLCGIRPPEASVVLNDGLPMQPLIDAGVSANTRSVVEKAMSPLKKDRYQTVAEMMNALGLKVDITDKQEKEKEKEKERESKEETLPPDISDSSSGTNTPEEKEKPEPKPQPKPRDNGWIYAVVAAVAIALGVLIPRACANHEPKPVVAEDSVDGTFTSTTTRTTTPVQATTTTQSDLHMEGNDIVYGTHRYNMVWVSGGTYTMGCTSEQGYDCFSDEYPSHSVSVGGFYMGKTEVPQWLWTAVMGSNPSNWKGDDLPVEQVSWNDCKDFISKLNNLTGKTFRLPTEEEWEFAARGGNSSRGYKYSGSDNLGSVAWYDGNSGSRTHPVGQKCANELVLYDMTGNVWEWCSSCWRSNYNNSTDCSYRVSRGGGWGRHAKGCRVSVRYYNTPSYRCYYLGFRLAAR